MPVCWKTSSFSSVAGATAGIGTAGTVPVGIGAAMHFAAGSAGAAREASAAGAFQHADQVSVPAVRVPVGLAQCVPAVDLAVPADLAQWRVLVVVGLVAQWAAVAVLVVVGLVVQWAAVAVQVVVEAAGQVVEAAAEVVEAAAAAIATNGSVAS